MRKVHCISRLYPHLGVNPKPYAWVEVNPAGKIMYMFLCISIFIVCSLPVSVIEKQVTLFLGLTRISPLYPHLGQCHLFLGLRVNPNPELTLDRPALSPRPPPLPG